MTMPSSRSLADAMRTGLEDRPAGRLRTMATTEQPAPFAVPLDQDAYDVAIDHIEPDPGQPRKSFDEDELNHLAASIRENGLLQPILVHRTEDPTKYRIIAGERRYRAARLAGLRTVPCLEMRDFDPELIDQLQLVENIQRADLRPLEAAEAIETYIERHDLSQREAARRLGKPTAFVAELLAIRRIPAHLLARKGAGELSKQTLVEVGRAPEGQQTQLLDDALAGSSLDQIRRRRVNRESQPRVVYFNERFLLDRFPALEIRWRRHPEDVTDDDLMRALEEVARQIAARHAR
jgi:ParB family chromosome partitioning protein